MNENLYLDKNILYTMVRSIIFLQVTVFLFLTGCTGTKTDLIVQSLRCENLYEPLGISTNTPRLSWKIRPAGNGKSQKAYQIIVASDKKLLNENDADLWNSGKTLSPSCVLVPYNGRELGSRSLCYWKVRVWDENDNPSEWSQVSNFSVGLLGKSDWHASYIGITGTNFKSSSPQLRKTFNLKSKGEKVYLHVNSLGYHEVYVNGEKVSENVLAPAVSQFNKRSLVITYDISSQVRRGRNDIVLWIGQGWYRKGLPGVASNVPLVKAQMEQLAEKQWKTVIVTDSSWTGRNSGYSLTGRWSPEGFGGERIEGSLLLPELSAQYIDTAAWTPVNTADVPEHNVTHQQVEPNRITGNIKALTIQPAGDSVWHADMGKALTGWVEIRLPMLTPGQEVKMEFCDHLTDDGKFVNQYQEDIYIATGKKREVFRNKFNYHGFRYIRFSNISEAPAKDDITAYLIQTGFSNSSSFECSDAELNRIHDMIFYTLRCLSLGGYIVDCPQLERLGYGGDGNASTETAQTMFDLAPLYANWLQAWADCIQEDGGMPHTAPNPYAAGGGPYWCGFIITASWKTYQNYGDIRFLEKYYPVMQQWLGYVESYSPSGLLEPWPETDYRAWYLGDWASPEGTDHTNKSSINTVNNCFIAVCYETMQKIAGVTGKKSDAESYKLKKDKIKSLIHKEFFDAARNIYGSGTQIDLTFPLLAGVVPDSLVNNVKKSLYDEILINHNGHIACGLVGIPVFTEWAVKNSEAELMYSILKKTDYPGYLYMINNGATATWEHWNGHRSRIHNCYNGIGSWFYQAIGGIRPDENHPGYQHIVISPQIPDGITWAKTSKETPYGTVSVNWKLENKMLSLDIEIPVGCTARVNLPKGPGSYTINGQQNKSETSYADIISGKYTIVVPV
jgi:alpha-L-rhamnosidase